MVEDDTPPESASLATLAGQALPSVPGCSFQDADEGDSSIIVRRDGYPFNAANVSVHDDSDATPLECTRDVAVEESPSEFVWSCYGASATVQVSSEAFDEETAELRYRAALAVARLNPR